MKVNLFLKTAGAECYLRLVTTTQSKEFIWQAERQLSAGIFNFIKQSLNELESDWQDIGSIVVFQGPGSFTSLRIGITVANSLANGLGIPIVGTNSSDWQKLGQLRLKQHHDDKIVSPLYDRPVLITPAKK